MISLAGPCFICPVPLPWYSRSSEPICTGDAEGDPLNRGDLAAASDLPPPVWVPVSLSGKMEGRTSARGAGQFPGDGKPKPVSFPDPAVSVVEIGGIRYLQLEKLIELKLASGMTNPGRLRDLADVQELIRVLGLLSVYADQLNPYVREKYSELWSAVQEPPD